MPQRAPLVLQTAAAQGAALALSQTAAGASAAAKAQATLAAAAISVKKALMNLIQGFDELHLAAQDVGTPVKPSKKPGGSSGGKKPSAPKKEKVEVELMPPNLGAVADWLKDLRDYISENMAPAISAWNDAFTQLKDAAGKAFSDVTESAGLLWDNALAPLGDYMLKNFLPTVVNSLSSAVAPIIADVGTMMMAVFATSFDGICRTVENAVNTLLRPALELVATIFSDMCTALEQVWAEYGTPLIEGITTAFEGIGGTLETLYNDVIQPVLSNLIATLTALWNDHLSPLWTKLLSFFGGIGALILTLWNNVLQPLLDFLVASFVPTFAAMGENVSKIFGTLGGALAAVIAGILDVLKGLCEFLIGTFTGDWDRAWNGVKDIFSGIWNLIVTILKNAVNAVITVINAVINGIAGAINTLVRGVNGIRFKIPAWIPGIGGQSFSANLSGITAPQIPLLARGAVIPPNAAFMAVLGDQKAGRNLEAPETLLRQIFREESGGTQRFTAEQPVELALDGDVFYRAMMRVQARRGVALGGVFADVI